MSLITHFCSWSDAPSLACITHHAFFELGPYFISVLFYFNLSIQIYLCSQCTCMYVCTWLWCVNLRFLGNEVWALVSFHSSKSISHWSLTWQVCVTSTLSSVCTAMLSFAVVVSVFDGIINPSWDYTCVWQTDREKNGTHNDQYKIKLFFLYFPCSLRVLATGKNGMHDLKKFI